MTTNFNLDSPTDNVGLISHLFYSLSLYYQIMQVKCSDYPIPPHRYHLQRCTSVLTYRGGGGGGGELDRESSRWKSRREGRQDGPPNANKYICNNFNSFNFPSPLISKVVLESPKWKQNIPQSQMG